MLLGKDQIRQSSLSSNFGSIRPGTAELAALKHLKNSHRHCMGKILLALLSLHVLFDLYFYR